MTDDYRTDENIRSDFEVTAYFEEVFYDLNYIAGEHGRIEGAAQQRVQGGSHSEGVTAIPDEDCLFIGWSDGVKTAYRQDRFVSGDLEVTALFEKAFEGGDGTLANPYGISTYKQFLNIPQFNKAGTHFALTGDIPLSGVKHEPLFDDSKRFQSNLDGKGFSITGMTVDSYTPFPSLLGFIGAYGGVKNLSITGFHITLTDYDTSIKPLCAGALCGVSFGTVENVSASGSITGNGLTHGGVCVGGLIGQAHTVLTDCHSGVDIRISNHKLRGDYGLNVGGLTAMTGADVYDCSADGSIYVHGIETGYIGGLIGTIYDLNYSPTVYIQNCHASVDIDSNGNSVGGLLGFTYNKLDYYIDNCSAKGNVSADSASGGLIGSLYANYFHISDCFATGNVYGQYWIGGLLGDISTMDSVRRGQVENCYATGNIESTFFNAGGFIGSSLNVNFYRCYATGTVIGTDGAGAGGGFASDITDSNVEECFSTGKVIGDMFLGGFAVGTSGTTVKNCYSSSDIYVKESKFYEVGGFVTMMSGEILNCYYSGKIIGAEGITTKDIFGFVSRSVYKDVVTNCHWARYPDTLAVDSHDLIHNNFNDDFDITSHEDITDLYSLADTLNEGMESPVWVNVPNGVPQLGFMIK